MSLGAVNRQVQKYRPLPPRHAGWAALLAAAVLLLLLPAHAQLSPGVVPSSPSWPTGPCTWSGEANALSGAA